MMLRDISILHANAEATGAGTDEHSDVKPVIQWLNRVEPGV